MTSYSRRDFARLALFGLPAVKLLSSIRPRAAGVQIGLNVPYSFGNNSMPADEVLKNCVALGVTALELRSQPVESFMGAPAAAANVPRTADSTARAAAAVLMQASRDKVRDWRLATSPSGAAALRKKYDDAGVTIGIVKFDNIYSMSDGELDFAFGLAKVLGARAISCEISTKDDDLRRVGSFADKHRIMVGYHGHTKVTPAIWENAFSLAKYNGANVDLGHFVAGNNYSPVEFIKKYHDRITHVHVKDRKLNEGPNVPFGEGDTPIVEVLRLIRDNGWPMQATIEFEYPVPAGSDRMTEIAKSLKFCRDAVA
jgi:Sugar phosphate isomerases/epimerases